MKTQKLNVLDFKQNELSREYISSINGGEPINPSKPGANTVGNGAGVPVGDEICYFDFEGELLYCVPKEIDPIITTGN